jgi:SAM-dependent methyltransferase
MFGDDHQLRARSFGAVSDSYQRFRPGYPVEAVRWALEVAPGDDVLDLAAGTGKLTRAVVDAGYRATAVEPSEQMLERLGEALPDVPSALGMAEHIPLEDGAVDAVVVGQAFHWFDGEAALAEIARVLRPAGVLALLFNLRDDGVPWVDAMMQLDGGGDRGSQHAVDDPWDDIGGHPSFGPVEQRRFPNPVAYDADGLAGFALSTSGVSTRLPAERDELLRRIHALALEHPDLRDHPTFQMPFVTVVGRSRRGG